MAQSSMDVPDTMSDLKDKATDQFRSASPTTAENVGSRVADQGRQASRRRAGRCW